MGDLLILAQDSSGFFPIFLQTLVKGLALGSVYAIMGIGFVIVFKGTQVLNFASGGMAMAGALFMSIMINDGGLPFMPWANPLAPVPGDQPSIPSWFVKLLVILVIAAIIGFGAMVLSKGTEVLNAASAAIVGVGVLFTTIMINDGRVPFLSWSIQADPGADPSIPRWLVNLFFALIFAAIMGMVLERIAIRPMVGQPLFSMAVITLGLETAIGPFNRDATSQSARTLGIPWKLEQWRLFDAGIPKSYVAAMVAAAVCFVAVNFFFRSRFGVAMRAVAFDQEAAQAQGINVGRVFSIAWGLGAALVTVAAIFYGMGPFPPQGTVSQEIHPILAFRVLPVIILGGLDSIPGALYGGLIIASAEVFAGQYLSQWTKILGAGYSTIVPYLVMLIVLLVRPYGLFGTEEIRRV